MEPATQMRRSQAERPSVSLARYDLMICGTSWKDQRIVPMVPSTLWLPKTSTGDG